MTAVGIDVSKGKSMAAAISQSKEVLIAPKEFLHTSEGFARIAAEIAKLGGETRVVMEATGHYHEAVAAELTAAGLYVSVVNPALVFDYGGNSLRRVKTDRKDALKISRYAIDNWHELREYTPQESLRYQLKMFSRQYNLSIKTLHAFESNLIAILDRAFPGANRLFSSRKRNDGRQKWVDFSESFWHAQIISEMSEPEFVLEYESWCRAKAYRFKAAKAVEIHEKCRAAHTTLRKSENTRLLIAISTAQITSISTALAAIKAEMSRLAKLLPEYEAVINLYGAGELTAAQLIAEIGDVRRFHSRGALVAFAGIDPLPQQSGKYDKKSTATSKRGSGPLRKTLFQIICTYLRRSPEAEPVYRFLDKKRAEGKPYFVYMTAAANKFLRIYYARVKEHLAKLEE